MKKNLIILLVIAAAGLFTAYYISKKKKRDKYFEYLNGNLGYGSFWLDQMSLDEIETVYIWITRYTQKGIHVPDGSPLDLKLLKLGAKFPALITYHN
jgi:hypothetical protein